MFAKDFAFVAADLTTHKLYYLPPAVDSAGYFGLYD